MNIDRCNEFKCKEFCYVDGDLPQNPHTKSAGLTLIIAMVCLVAPQLALGAVIRVPLDYGTIQEGMSAALTGDTVLVADGTYTGSGNKDLTFAGLAFTVASENGPDPCIIDCQGSDRGFDVRNGEGPGSVIEGFTIRNGTDTGCGVNCYQTSPMIRNCVITGGASWSWGGGIYGYESSAEVTNCLVYGNTSELQGGGIYFYLGSSIVQNCTITGNSSQDDGGGLYAYGGGQTVTDCIIWGNTTDQIYASGSPAITYCNVQGGYSGTGNIDADPMFVLGPLGSHYLWQDCDGLGPYSSCVDAGSDLASAICFTAYLGLVCMDDLTTRTDAAFDSGQVDMGFHYAPAVGPTRTPTPTPTLTPTPTSTPTSTPPHTPIIIRVPLDYGTIQEGMSAALTGDTVLVADGIYTGSGNKNLTFSGLAFTVASENGPDPCIIDCQGSGRGFDVSSGEGPGSVIEGFTIRNGTDTGCGVNCYQTSPTIRNCVITGGASGSWGGGVFGYESSSVVTNCLIYGNTSELQGGGIYFYMGSSIVQNCTITGNSSQDDGGGLYAYGGGQTVTDCIIWGNTTDQIYASGSPAITYCNVQGGYSGTGNIDADPLFELGPLGLYYLRQDCDGLGPYSSCVDAGSDLASAICFTAYLGLVCMDDLTTRTDAAFDSGQVDMGFHYAPAVGPTRTPTPTPTLTPTPTSTPTSTPPHTPIVIRVPLDYGTIQEGMSAALTGDTVLVADGTYTGSGNKDLTFAGLAFTVASENGPDPCIIDCQGSGRGFDVRNGEGPGSVIEGFTIRNGTDTGCGVNCYQTSPTIRNCVITGGASGSWGGGVFGYESSSVVTNCLVYGNTSELQGGGIYFYMGSSIVQNCTITGNSSQDDGGGLYAYGGGQTVTDCIIWGNTTDQIYASGSPAITYCDVQGGYSGTGNIDADPLFELGPLGLHYLRQDCDGLGPYSPCVDAGSDLASAICFPAYPGLVCMDDLTTRTDVAFDSGQVDMGFHFARDEDPTPTPTFTASPTPTAPIPIPTTSIPGLLMLGALLSLAIGSKKIFPRCRNQ